MSSKKDSFVKLGYPNYFLLFREEKKKKEKKTPRYSSGFFLLHKFDGKPERTNSTFQKERKKYKVGSADLLDVLGKEIRRKL